jgi:bifunctional enzyme CysN/CysC
MDLVDWSQERFDEIREQYLEFAKPLDLIDPVFLPMSALLGDNVVEKSDNLAWYDGPTMMEHLETVDVEAGIDIETFRLPVQMVTRPDLDFRGFAGTIASGVVRPGDKVSQPAIGRLVDRRPHRHDGRRSPDGRTGPRHHPHAHR